MIKLKISKSKNKLKAYFLYIFILIFSLILLVAYNSCGESEFSSSSSKTDPNNNPNLVSKTETHIIPNSSASDSKKEIDFIFIVETSLATAQTDYTQKINKFLEFITDGVHLDSYVSIARMGSFRADSNPEFKLWQKSGNIVYEFPAETTPNRYSHYIYVRSIGTPPSSLSSPPLGPDPLKTAFSLISSSQIAMDRDQIGSQEESPLDQLKNILRNRISGTILNMTRTNVPLEIIVISAISIGPLNSDATVISEPVINNISTRFGNMNFKMSAITTTGTPCSGNVTIASDENGSSSRLLQEVAQQVSRNENPVIIDICSNQSNYDRQLGAILRPHGIIYPNVRKTSFNLHHTPTQEFPITIKKRSGDSWIELSDDINYSIEFTDGNTLFVLTQPHQNLLPPGEYQIHYTTKQASNTEEPKEN